MPPPLRASPVTLFAQAEIVNIQKEKERITTTTIDDELAADPEMAKVGREGSIGTGACTRE